MKNKESEKVFLRAPDVLAAFGISKSTLYARVDEGLIPAPVKISTRIIGWPKSEIDVVAAARLAGQSEASIKSLIQRLYVSRKAVADLTLCNLGGENNAAETSTV